MFFWSDIVILYSWQLILLFKNSLIKTYYVAELFPLLIASYKFIINWQK